MFIRPGRRKQPPVEAKVREAMRRNSPEIHPLAGAIGVEISGVDLADEVDDDTIAVIRRAWLDHLVIFFRGQNLPPARFLAFARRFGKPVEYPFVRGIDGFPLITPVVKLAHERVNFGGLWHSDTAYLETPPMGTMLIAREVPPYGGDTLFANMHLAYEAMSACGGCSMASSRSIPRLRPTSPRRARIACARVLAMMPGPNMKPSIRSCVPIPRPARRRSTSMAVTPCGSRT
jgi:alpha-ketoglutarate-dependent taurine dioxygenase